METSLLSLAFRSIVKTQIPPALNLGTGGWVQKPKAPPDYLEAHVNNHPYHPLRAFCVPGTALSMFYQIPFL